MSDTTWLPLPDDLASLLRARTKDSNGQEIGAWTDETRPTLSEVERIIELAARETVGTADPGIDCGPVAGSATLYRAACLVELSYFPEQVRSDRSAYAEYKTLLDEAVAALNSCLAAGGTGPTGGQGEGWTYHSLPVYPAWQEFVYGWRHPEDPSTWQQPCFAPDQTTPALIDDPEPLPPPSANLTVGHPAEGDATRGLPPIITDGTG